MTTAMTAREAIYGFGYIAVGVGVPLLALYVLAPDLLAWVRTRLDRLAEKKAAKAAKAAEAEEAEEADGEGDTAEAAPSASLPPTVKPGVSHDPR